MLPYLRRLVPAKSDAAAKEVKRTLLNTVPGGTSSAASKVRPIWYGRLDCGCQPIVLARRPHLVQHHGQLARQGDFGLAQAAALGQPSGPGL